MGLQIKKQTHMNIPWPIFAFSAALLLTFTMLMEKKSLARMHALEMSTEESFYGLLLAFILLPFVAWRMDASLYMILLFNGLLLALANLLFNKALRHGEVSEVAPLLNLDVLTTMIFAVIFLSEFPSFFQLAGVLLVFTGTYLLQLRTKKNLFAPFRSLFHSRSGPLVLIAVCIYGLAAIVAKNALNSMSVLSYIFFLWLTLLIWYSILDFAYHRENITHLIPLLRQHGLLFFAASVGFFLYRLVIFTAMSAGPVTLVASIGSSSTFFTALIGGRIFGEANTGRRALASLIIILGAAFIIL